MCLHLIFWKLKKNNYKWYLMVGSWGRSEVGSAPSSDLFRSWGKTCGRKMGQPGLKTSTPTSDQGLVARWGRPVLRPGRSEDGAQHIYFLYHLSLLLTRDIITCSMNKKIEKNYILLFISYFTEKFYNWNRSTEESTTNNNNIPIHQKQGLQYIPNSMISLICCAPFINLHHFLNGARPIQLINGAPIYKWCSTIYQHIFAPFINGAALTINIYFN